MPSVQPITVSDLNGIEFNPGEMVINDVVGYVGYVRNLCTDLGTSRDTKEGHQDFLNFQSEIQNAVIETFEPDEIDTGHSFETIDLTGSKDSIHEYPKMIYNACIRNKIFYSYDSFITPFDLPDKGDLKAKKFVTPYDLDEIQNSMNTTNASEELELT
jgi:hypothetical protein